MASIAIIGGTGAQLFPAAASARERYPDTEWGKPSAPLREWQQDGHDILFLSRHGVDGNIPPHRVNYRANIAALSTCGTDYVIALNAVGAIAADIVPGSLVLPDQLIDYTSGRAHSRYEGEKLETQYVDFTKPYDDKLRKILIKASGNTGIGLHPSGTYGVTQGPRLETAAEIDRLEQDGCSLVGMTAMPEAVLAREYGLPYASCAIVVNAAAGRSSTAIHAEIDQHLNSGMAAAAGLIAEFVRII
jgi:5'-methylthioinosine phosphorylase